MPKYRVTLLRPAKDLLTAYVVVEAATPEEADEMAFEKALDVGFSFFACGDETFPLETYRIQEITEDEDWQCPSCGETLQDGSGFCVRCGHDDVDDAPCRKCGEADMRDGYDGLCASCADEEFGEEESE